MKTLEQAAQLEQRHAATMLHTQGVVDENTRLRAALDVAEGALKEIQECADAIKRNLREDIEPTLRDNMWVITAACHATVIEQALARIAEARKGQP